MLQPGDEVTITSGPFHGLKASVLRFLPAADRVQLLLELLDARHRWKLPGRCDHGKIHCTATGPSSRRGIRAFLSYAQGILSRRDNKIRPCKRY